MAKCNFSYPLQNNDFLSFESIEIIDYITDDILERGAKKLYYKYLNENLPNHNGQYIIDINRGVLQIEMIKKEEGENQFTYINKWNEEEEPIASKIDSWGTLTIRREVKQQQNINLYGGVKTEDDAKSSKSFSTIKSYTLRSAKSKISAAIKMKNNMADIMESSKLVKSPTVTPKIMQKIIDENPIKKDDNYYKDERLRTEREVKAKEKNEEMAKKAKKQQEEEDAKERIKIKINKLRNKEYTYDYNGEIIYFRPIRTENLPAEIPVLDHNYKAPPEVLKQPYENLGIKIKESEEIVARSSFTKEEILKQMQKAKDQKKSPPKKMPLSKNKKIQQNEEEDAPPEGIELPRQIPLVEIMEAKTGVNIFFDNGFLKEGKIFKKEGRMKKEEFGKVLEERKKMLEDQRKITRLDEKSQSDNDKNNEFKKQVEKIKELKSSTENNIEFMNNLGLDNKKQVLIHEESEYVKMMATNLLGPQVDIRQLEKRIATNSMISQAKSKLNKEFADEKVRIERVTSYKKVDLFDGQMPKRPLTTKSTKLHQIVEDFNENEVINNPKWGSAIFSENHLNKERISAIPIKKLTSPAFEKDRGIKLRERGKLTSGNFFPRIESPNSNLYKKINNQKK